MKLCKTPLSPANLQLLQQWRRAPDKFQFMCGLDLKTSAHVLRLVADHIPVDEVTAGQRKRRAARRHSTKKAA